MKSTALSLCLHAVVLGGAGPISSLSTSWRLTQGCRLAMGALLVALAVLGLTVVGLGVGLGSLLKPVGGQALALAVRSTASGFDMLFFMGALGEAYRQLGGAQTPR